MEECKLMHDSGICLQVCNVKTRTHSYIYVHVCMHTYIHIHIMGFFHFSSPKATTLRTFVGLELLWNIFALETHYETGYRPAYLQFLRNLLHTEMLLTAHSLRATTPYIKKFCLVMFLWPCQEIPGSLLKCAWNLDSIEENENSLHVKQILWNNSLPDLP